MTVTVSFSDYCVGVDEAYGYGFGDAATASGAIFMFEPRPVARSKSSRMPRCGVGGVGDVEVLTAAVFVRLTSSASLQATAVSWL